MSTTRRTERIDTLVIGGGQAGLSVGYHLARRGVPFRILDANERVGDPWRKRWDSLRLFTPARYSGLDGMPFPAPPTYFPTKDEMADYLEAYARRFRLPVRCGARVRRLTRENGRFVALTEDARFEADDVVVAMSDDQRPRVPGFADELDGGIRALHSADYSGQDPCSWWAREIRAPTSPWSSPTAAPCGCRVRIGGTSPSVSSGASLRRFWFRSSCA